MDDFKPEDDMKADRNDRRAGRSRQSSERDADPQINFDDVDLDADEGRPTRAGKARREREEEEFEEELDAQDEEMLEEQPVERRPRKRKKAPAKPASRQYIMMGVGILVLLLLIVGIGSALKSPSSSSQQTASGEKSINLSDDQSASMPAAGQDQTAAANSTSQQDVTVPPIAANPTQGQAAVAPQGQQRINVVFQPAEEFTIQDHPVLDDLSQSGSELALRQSFQTVKINYHGNRLPEGANHVFAERVVHCGFAADRRVDLRQQGGRDLDETHAALIACRGETG